MDLPSSSAIQPVLVPGSRRSTWCARFFDWAAESRARRVILLVIGIWILNAFDLVLTILSHEQGLLQEGNPIARWILDLGTPSVVLFKIGLVMIGSYPLLRFRAARITELGTLVILVAYALLAVHWSTCYELYATTINADITYADLNAITEAAAAP